MKKTVSVLIVASLLSGCLESTPKTEEEFAQALGKHAGKAEYNELVLNGQGPDSDTTDVRYAEVIYARYWVCSFSMNAMSKGNLTEDIKIWSAYNTAFRERAQNGKNIATPLKLESRAVKALGDKCEDFVANSPDWIVQDPSYGPFSKNPS